MRLLSAGKSRTGKKSGTARKRQQARRPRMSARRMRQVLIGTGFATLTAIVAASGWHAARTGAIDELARVIDTVGTDVSNELGLVVSDILVEGRYRTERSDLVAAIAAGNADLAVTANRAPDPGVRMEPILTTQSMCMIPPGHPLGEKEVIRPEDLAGLDFVGFVDSTMSGRAFDRLFAKMQHPPVQKMKSYLSHIVSALVMRGMGVGIVDAFTAEDHRSMGGVVRPVDIVERFEYSIIKPHGDKLSGECVALVDYFERSVLHYQDT